jgi:hypothetical protein
MMNYNVISGTKVMLLAGVLVSGIAVSPVRAQTAAPAVQPRVAPAPYRFRPNGFSTRREMYYSSVWGVDSLGVKAVESGEIIRFTYRILDANLAKTLNDKKLDPALISFDKGVKLVIPSLEQVGQLRQSSTPVAGKSYWMAFSNSGRLLKRGDRVDVVIGNFHAKGLIVE